MYQTNNDQLNHNTSNNRSIDERRWDLLQGVRKGLEELSNKHPDNDTIPRFVKK